MIYSKTHDPIVQPQSDLVKLGIQIQHVPVIGNSISKLVTNYCNNFKEDENTFLRIKRYADTYDIHPQEIERCYYSRSDEECWKEFNTLNEFFIRRRTNLPPVRRTRNEIVSPTDAYTVFVTRPTFWIKGSKYTTGELMKGSNKYYLDLALFIFRLAPHHYHRVHSPVYGKVMKISTFGNEYNSVDVTTVKSRKNILTRNIRIVIEIQTSNFGKIYLAIIGATCVGSIVIHHPQILKALDLSHPFTDIDIRDQPIVFSVYDAPTLKINEELGYFQYGGSCVVLGISSNPKVELSQIGEIVLDHTLEQAETELEVGDSLLISRK
jgi:phosphatidylserine decarboxylase